MPLGRQQRGACVLVGPARVWPGPLGLADCRWPVGAGADCRGFRATLPLGLGMERPADACGFRFGVDCSLTPPIGKSDRGLSLIVLRTDQTGPRGVLNDVIDKLF